MGDINSSSCSSHDDYGFGDINVAHGGEGRNDPLNMEDMFIEESCKRPLFSCNSVCAAGVKRKFSHDHNNGGVLDSASSEVAEDHMFDLHAEFLAIRKSKEQEAGSDCYSQNSWPTYSAHGEPSLCASQNWGFCSDVSEDDLDAETVNEDLEWNNVYELDLEVNLVEDNNNIEGETATGILFSDFGGEEEYHSMLTFEPPSLVCSREVSVAGTGATNSPAKHNEYMNIGLHADLNSLQGESSALAGINWDDEFAVDLSENKRLADTSSEHGSTSDSIPDIIKAGVPTAHMSKAQILKECTQMRNQLHNNKRPMFIYLASLAYVKVTQGISQRHISMFLNITSLFMNKVLSVIVPPMAKAVGNQEAINNLEYLFDHKNKGVPSLSGLEAEDLENDIDQDTGQSGDHQLNSLGQTYQIPNTYSKVCRKLRMLKQIIHRFPVCENNCEVLYERPHCSTADGPEAAGKDGADIANLYKACSVCQSSKISKTSFYVISLEERIRRWFYSKTFCELMKHQSAYMKRNELSTEIKDVYDGEVWANLQKDQFFDSPYNIVFMLVLDGVQAKKKKSLSLWPIILCNLSLPASLRMKTNMWTTFGIGSGHLKQLNMRSYLKILIQELNKLYLEGITVYDALAKEFRTIRCTLLVSSCDYPALMTLLNLKRCPACLGCSKCNTMGTRCNKSTYYTRTFEFLSPDHELRVQVARELYADFSEEVAMDFAYGQPPEKKTKAYVHKCITDRIHSDDSGVIGYDTLWDLKNFDAIKQVIHDHFHIWQNIGKRWIKITSGKLDSDEAREYERKRGRFVEEQSYNFILSEKDGQKKVDARATEKKHLPFGWVESAKPVYDRSVEYLKGHDMVGLFSDYGKMVYLDILPDTQYNAFCLLCDCVQRSAATYFNSTDDIELLERDIYECLTILTLALPYYVNSISFSLFKHAAENIKNFGPARGNANYAAEHVMGDLTKGCHSTRQFALEMMHTATLKENMIWVLMDILDPAQSEEPGSTSLKDDGTNMQTPTYAHVTNVLKSLLSFTHVVDDQAKHSEKDNIGLQSKCAYDREAGLYSMGFENDEEYQCRPGNRVKLFRPEKIKILNSNGDFPQPAFDKLLCDVVVQNVPALKRATEVYNQLLKRIGRTQLDQLGLKRACPLLYKSLSSEAKRLLELGVVGNTKKLNSLLKYQFYCCAHIGRKKMAYSQSYDSKWCSETSNSFIAYYQDPNQSWSPSMDPCVANGHSEPQVSFGRIVTFLEVSLLNEILLTFAIVEEVPPPICTHSNSRIGLALLRSGNLYKDVLDASIVVEKNPGLLINNSAPANNLSLKAIPCECILPRNVVPWAVQSVEKHSPGHLRRLLASPAWKSDVTHTEEEFLLEHLFYMCVFK